MQYAASSHKSTGFSTDVAGEWVKRLGVQKLPNWFTELDN
jgi:hypothetical protein